MKNKLMIYEIFSIIFTLFLGIILHFTYEISNYNVIVSLFSSVNESTWEHLKILFFPMLIVTIVGSIYFKNIYYNYLCIKVRGILIALLFVIIFFYTYTGIIGTNYPILDISSFVIAVIISEVYTYINIINKKNCNKLLSIIILILLTILFIVFTYYPPKINLFKDPINNSYGVIKQDN